MTNIKHQQTSYEHVNFPIHNISDQSISSLPSTSLEGHGTELLENHHRATKVEETVLLSPHDGRVDDVRPVGGSNDEDILLAAHTVHFGQNLVDYL